MKKLLAILALVASSAFAATTVPVQLLNPTGSTSGQTIVSTGASSAPGWATVPLSGLSSIAANTVLANATAASAAPAAFAMPSCSGATNAIGWTTSTGFTCNAAINAATLGGATFAAPGNIGFTTAGTGNFTALNSTSGSLNGSIGQTTAFAGSFTTVSATSTITPSQTAGIVGTTTNNNANAGSVGEYVTANSSGVSMTSAATANCTSASLTAGDWDVQAIINLIPNASTTIASGIAGVSTTSATLGGYASFTALVATLTTGTQQTLSSPVVRVSIASTTTVYAVGQSTFGVSTMTCNGTIRARRVR